MNIKSPIIATSVLILCTTMLFASDQVLPKPISSSLPAYPERARLARISGAVRLSFVLDGKGHVTKVNPVSGNPILNAAAADVVRSWKFDPKDIRSDVRHETEFVYVLNVQKEQGSPVLRVSLVDFRHVEIVSELYVSAIE